MIVERFVDWYAALPVYGKGGLTVLVGVVAALVVFAIVKRLVRKILHSVVAAVLSFLLATVPGNLILQNAATQLENQVGSHLSMNSTDES